MHTEWRVYPRVSMHRGPTLRLRGWGVHTAAGVQGGAEPARSLRPGQSSHATGARPISHAPPLPHQQGFGNIDGEYWLGLENIYWLTNQGNYKLLVTMEDWSGRKVFAEYASFRLEPESDYYKLRLGRYHGNAGDSFTWHNGKQFTTLDRDHDVYTGTGGPLEQVPRRGAERGAL